jgi:hypothetical protein
MCDLFEKFGERFEFDAPPHRSQPFRLRPDVHVGDSLPQLRLCARRRRSSDAGRLVIVHPEQVGELMDIGQAPSRTNSQSVTSW